MQLFFHGSTPTEPPDLKRVGWVLVCALAQLQRGQQAEGGMRLRDVSREVHGQEYSGFYLGAQPQP